MALTGPWSTCAICHGALDRPYTATSGPPFVWSAHLAAYYDAPLHFECLAGWTEREEFSREYFASDLDHYSSGYGTLLWVTPDWMLACGVADPGEDPHFVQVSLATWPFGLYSKWSDWNAYVNGGFRRGLVGPPLDVANVVMTQVQKVAPSIKALELIRTERSAQPVEERSLVELGSFLATLWGESAYRTDWHSLERQRRADSQAMAERERLRAEAIARSNEMTRRLAIELAIGGSLRCPHCRRQTHEMRFVDPGEGAQSYFICRRCGRSFAGSEGAQEC